MFHFWTGLKNFGVGIPSEFDVIRHYFYLINGTKCDFQARTKVYENLIQKWKMILPELQEHDMITETAIKKKIKRLWRQRNQFQKCPKRNEEKIAAFRKRCMGTVFNLKKLSQSSP